MVWWSLFLGLRPGVSGCLEGWGGLGWLILPHLVRESAVVHSIYRVQFIEMVIRTGWDDGLPWRGVRLYMVALFCRCG